MPDTGDPPTRIGLVGTGFIAEAHAAAYDAVDRAEVVAVTAPSGAAEFAAGVPGAAGYDDLGELLAADVDAVDVCVPTPAHREVVEAVPDDLPVLCEKPLARSLADARALADRERLMVGHVVRFSPAYRRARDHLDDAAVVRTRRIGPMPDWADWYADPSRSGGVLLDLAIHDFDYLRWTLGPVERVFVRRRRWGDGEAHAVTTLRHESGAVAHVEASWAQPGSRAFTTSFEAAGPGTLLEYDAEDPTGFRRYCEDGATRETPAGRSAMARQLAAFVDWVEWEVGEADLRMPRRRSRHAGGSPPVSGAEALAAVRVSLAAIESAERGDPVAPGEVAP